MIDTPGQTLHLERMYEAPQDRVFKAWSSSEAVSAWFGLDPAAKTIAEVDFREGGLYILNSGAYTVRGIYKEISPYDKISFTWLWDHDPEVPEMLVSLEFVPTNTGTKMILIHDHIADQERLEQHKYGWDIALPKIQENLA